MKRAGKLEPAIGAPVVPEGIKPTMEHYYEAARVCPQRKGENLGAWFTRIAEKAHELAQPRLPYVEREPGSDDE